MNAMLFELIDGQPVPRLPRAADGSPRVPDGVALLTLDQAAAKTGRSPEQLAKLWHATLEEMFPGAADLFIDADKPPTPARDDLRRAMFPELADAELATQFEFLCTRRGLDPWCGQVRPKILVNADGSRRVELMLCIEAFRLVAHRTGVYAGCDDTEFTYLDEIAGGAGGTGAGGTGAGGAGAGKPPQIDRATTTVYKLVAGNRCGWTASVRWHEYAGIPTDEQIKTFRDQMPHVWLGKCSEAAALRKAFPQELGGIYTPEEMSAIDARPRSPRKPTAIDDADQRRPADDDTSQLPEWERARRRQAAAV